MALVGRKISDREAAKRELLTAVFQRRAEILNAERFALLEHVRRATLTLTFAKTGRIEPSTRPRSNSARPGPRRHRPCAPCCSAV